MKRLLITVILVILMTSLATIAMAMTDAEYRAFTSNSEMKSWELLILRKCIQDNDFFFGSQPTWDQFTEEIKSLPYFPDSSKGTVNSPSSTLMGGGDCEDHAIFAIARLFQLDTKYVGFMILGNRVNTDGHLVAVFKQRSETYVIEFQLEKKIWLLSDYLQKTSQQFVGYRIWWFFVATEHQPSYHML